MKAPSFGCYVHVPFCSALCPYCDFAVVVGRPELHERYCDALVAEATAAEPFGRPAETLFVGGGTPSFVDPLLLARTIERLRALAAVREDAELTIEANPESVDARALRALRAAGVNRLSIGAQSLRDHVLRGLGRTHDAKDVGAAVTAARAAGFDNVGLDLIYGGPGESPADWTASLRAAIALEPEHLSCYALTIEPRTPFGEAVTRGRMAEPTQDALADRYEIAVDLLSAAGFEHYEISNWAKPGKESRHNLLYWTQGDYIGLGLGAHSHRAGVRSWNTRALKRYLTDPARARDGQERLDARQRAEEWLALRLRLVEGVDIADASRRLDRDLTSAAATLTAAGLTRLDGSQLRLTTRGLLLENEVALHLLNNAA